MHEGDSRKLLQGWGHDRDGGGGAGEWPASSRRHTAETWSSTIARYDRPVNAKTPPLRTSAVRRGTGERGISGAGHAALAMPMHASVEERLARLTADQRAAAIAPPGPVLCVAPAG